MIDLGCTIIVPVTASATQDDAIQRWHEHIHREGATTTSGPNAKLVPGSELEDHQYVGNQRPAYAWVVTGRATKP